VHDHVYVHVDVHVDVVVIGFCSCPGVWLMLARPTALAKLASSTVAAFI
jgi:hypothetical protein